MADKTTKDPNNLTFYITKYACTKGVLKQDGFHIYKNVYDKKAKYASKGPLGFYLIGVDAFEDAQEAHANAVGKVTRKLASLVRQQAKLEKLRAELALGAK